MAKELGPGGWVARFVLATSRVRVSSSLSRARLFHSSSHPSPSITTAQLNTSPFNVHQVLRRRCVGEGDRAPPSMDHQHHRRTDAQRTTTNCQQSYPSTFRAYVSRMTKPDMKILLRKLIPRRDDPEFHSTAVDQDTRTGSASSRRPYYRPNIWSQKRI